MKNIIIRIIKEFKFENNKYNETKILSDSE